MAHLHRRTLRFRHPPVIQDISIPENHIRQGWGGGPLARSQSTLQALSLDPKQRQKSDGSREVVFDISSLYKPYRYDVIEESPIVILAGWNH